MKKKLLKIKKLIWCFISLTIIAVMIANVHIAMGGQRDAASSDLTLNNIEAMADIEINYTVTHTTISVSIDIVAVDGPNGTIIWVNVYVRVCIEAYFLSCVIEE